MGNSVEIKYPFTLEIGLQSGRGWQRGGGGGVGWFFFFIEIFLI